MPNPKLLAAKMSVKPINYASAGIGGAPIITGMDISAALAMGGAKRDESLMVMLKWVQDESAQKPLFYLVYDRVVGMVSRKKWKIPSGGQMLRKLTRLAIYEVVQSGKCPRCHGTAIYLKRPEGKIVPCKNCGGTGNSEFTGREKARIVGIDESNWRRLWVDRYAEIREMVSSIDHRGLSALSRGIGD